MRVKIEKLDNFGRGITYDLEKIAFISNTLPGEEVDVDITNTTKKYLEGVVSRHITISSDRCDALCPNYNKCGGCSLRHLEYHLENKFKEDKVRDIMRKFGGIDGDIVKDICYSSCDNYRNKVVLHGSNGMLGLYSERSNEVIEIDRCMLLNDKINDVINVLNKVNKNISDVIIKTSNDLKHVLVSVGGEVLDTKELLDMCDVFILNDKVLTGDKYILTSIGDTKYFQSRDSFFQVNTTLTKNLYDKVYEYLSYSNNLKVLDLYCGTGTIGIYISDLCSNIIGIDYNKYNIDDANRNKELNSISNISFICDKVENRIDSFKDIDAIVVDPPRAGLDSKTVSYLLKIQSQRIVYVSCDPATLARDLKALSEEYTVKEITPFNMFPRTYHVECVCLLYQKK